MGETWGEKGRPGTSGAERVKEIVEEEPQCKNGGEGKKFFCRGGSHDKWGGKTGLAGNRNTRSAGKGGVKKREFKKLGECHKNHGPSGTVGGGKTWGLPTTVVQSW